MREHSLDEGSVLTVAAKNAPTSARRRAWQPLSYIGDYPLRIALFLALLASWQAYVSLSGVNALLVPGPIDVARAFVENLWTGDLSIAAVATARSLAIGTLLGTLLGLALAALAVTSRVGANLMALLFSIFTPLPSIAMLPLVMIWFGFTTTSVIIIVVNSTMWPVAVNTETGIRSISQTMLRVADTLGIRGSRRILEIELPAALPYILSGLKMAWAFGWRTVVSAELLFGAVGAAGGLGWFINNNRNYMRTADVFAGLVLISFMGVLVEAVFSLAQRRTVERWGMTRKSGS